MYAIREDDWVESPDGYSSKAQMTLPFSFYEGQSAVHKQAQTNLVAACAENSAGYYK